MESEMTPLLLRILAVVTGLAVTLLGSDTSTHGSGDSAATHTTQEAK